MSLRLYMDVHVHGAITRGLHRRGVDVLTSQADGTDEWEDSALLDRATQLNRVLFSQDKHLLREAAQRQDSSIGFSGLFYADQLRITIGQAVADLELAAKVYDPPDMANQVVHLPL